MAKPGRHNQKTRSPKQMMWSGRFVGINGADPTTLTVDDGVTVERTGEGVWDVVLPLPVAGFKSVVVGWADNGGAYHEVTHVVDVATATITITHNTVAFASIASGVAASDIIDEINFIAVVELSDVPGTGL